MTLGAGIATGYGLDGPGIESWWGRDFPHPSRPALGPPSLLCNGQQVFTGGKAAGAWRWPPTPSSAEVKERVELYLYSTSGPSWPVIGRTLPLPLPPIFMIQCNSILSYTPRSSKGSFRSYFSTKTLHAFPLSLKGATRSAHLILTDSITPMTMYVIRFQQIILWVYRKRKFQSWFVKKKNTEMAMGNINSRSIHVGEFLGQL
jgi:hypothetical protein